MAVQFRGGSTSRSTPKSMSKYWYDVAAGSATVAWITGSNRDLWVTGDAVATWTPQVSGVTIPLFGTGAVSATIAWAVGSGGPILKTVDGGANWAAQASGTTATLRDIHPVDASVVWAVGDAGTILKTVDGDNDCTASDADPWRPVARVAADGTGTLATSTSVGATTTTIDLLFGLRVGSSQPAGQYSAPVTFEAVAPNV